MENIRLAKHGHRNICLASHRPPLPKPFVLRVFCPVRHLSCEAPLYGVHLAHRPFKGQVKPAKLLSKTEFLTDSYSQLPIKLNLVQQFMQWPTKGLINFVWLPVCSVINSDSL